MEDSPKVRSNAVVQCLPRGRRYVDVQVVDPSKNGKAFGEKMTVDAFKIPGFREAYDFAQNGKMSKVPEMCLSKIAFDISRAAAAPKGTPLSTKRFEVSRYVDFYNSGSPATTPDRSAGLSESDGYLLQAMVERDETLPEAKRFGVDKLRRLLTEATRAQRVAMSLDPRVADRYKALVEAATADIDTDEVLAGW